MKLLTPGNGKSMRLKFFKRSAKKFVRELAPEKSPELALGFIPLNDI